MQNIGKSVLRVAKNSVKGYSEYAPPPLSTRSGLMPRQRSVQTKVRDATSNDPWGPSGTQCVDPCRGAGTRADEFVCRMSEIAALTFNQSVPHLPLGAATYAWDRGNVEGRSLGRRGCLLDWWGMVRGGVADAERAARGPDGVSREMEGRGTEPTQARSTWND